jgi:hypothetical protein
MAATVRYKIVQITSDAMMPIGRSRLGFFASSAVVETASKPMYAKNTTAPAAMMPDQPYGAKGDQFSGFTNAAPAPMKNTTATSLIPTMTALARADSRTPTTNRTMMTRTIKTARILMTPTGGAVESAVGRVMPTPCSRRCM